ncbi:16S rRNA (uracil(1498)-N(3))-methyltransferase [uncultured Pseudacidovorax sp.]|uniref:16S rRNA (uracil(1498)-N(3))-methyltransferase n=1 Tax=uncultured Pseudacidovorax sp. TaxID=679313 RepID=UPI0025D06131|nr:16S rRNA (uracil(1498)-N(3))-methyltransferase [uncultured Pseudacidovorax sp.]
MPRIHCATPLAPGAQLGLPPGAARHVQVLRLQPGDTLTLFDGRGGEFGATVTRMGRSDVDVQVGARLDAEREADIAVHLAVGMPANDRMDWLVEKATELGVASIQPLQTAHGVLRLAGERAQKKQDHWQAVAVAACEQCGRNRVPPVHPVRDLGAWLEGLGDDAPAARHVLGFGDAAQPLGRAAPAGGSALFLSGPEGGLNPQEEARARARGFVLTTLGPRILRAETAPLAALIHLLAVAG